MCEVGGDTKGRKGVEEIVEETPDWSRSNVERRGGKQTERMISKASWRS